MTYIRNDEKFDAAMKSVEARRRKVEANGYAAGALVLANNNSSFLKWGRRAQLLGCLLYTSPSPRDRTRSRMPSSA